MRTKGIWTIMLFMVVIGMLVSIGCATPQASTTSTASSSTAPQAKVIELKASGYMPAGTGPNLHMKWWGEEVTKRTNGRVKIQYFTDASLISATGNLKGISDGIADMGYVAPSYTPSIMIMSGVGECMNAASTPDHASRAYDELIRTNESVRAEFTSNNLKYLCPSSCYIPYVNCSQPISNIDALKNLKLRAYGQQNDALKILGGVPVNIGINEVYESIQRKVVDGTLGVPFDFSLSTKVYEVAPYFADIGFETYVNSPLIMNLNTWNNLPSDIQKIIEEVNKESAANAQFVVIEGNQMRNTVKKMVDGGAKWIEWSPSEKQKVVDLTIPTVWKSWIDRANAAGLPAEATVQQYSELCKKSEKEYPNIYKNPGEYFKEFNAIYK